MGFQSLNRPTVPARAAAGFAAAAAGFAADAAAAATRSTHRSAF